MSGPRLQCSRVATASGGHTAFESWLALTQPKAGRSRKADSLRSKEPWRGTSGCCDPCYITSENVGMPKQTASALKIEGLELSHTGPTS